MIRMFLAAIFCMAINTGFAQSQAEMNQDAGKAFAQADKDLNTVYQKILKEYKADTAFTKSLKASQKIWVKFRDAEMLAKFPNREAGYYGSVLPTCWANYKAELTYDRTKKLQVWLDGIPEGDVCTGSVKMKQ